jgi:archaellum biogenesis ATPase FlaH
MHFYSNGKQEEANKIWTEHLSKSNRIMFQHICRTSRNRSDPILCSNLLGLLISTENVSAGAKGNVLSCLLDVLSKNLFDAFNYKAVLVLSWFRILCKFIIVTVTKFKFFALVPASNQQFDEALVSLQAAQKDVGLELVNSTALIRLKTGLESQGKVFPFTIPSKVGTTEC